MYSVVIRNELQKSYTKFEINLHHIGIQHFIF